MGNSTKQGGLTKLELRIMQAVWKRGGGTVSEVQAELDTTLAYTTVQTMLNILERKGKLKRELDGRAYVYTAKITEAKALGQQLRDLVVGIGQRRERQQARQDGADPATHFHRTLLPKPIRVTCSPAGACPCRTT